MLPTPKITKGLESISPSRLSPRERRSKSQSTARESFTNASVNEGKVTDGWMIALK